jgi:hypothetical protein
MIGMDGVTILNTFMVGQGAHSVMDVSLVVVSIVFGTNLGSIIIQGIER